MVERQTGLKLWYEKSGTPFSVESNASVHTYRILQEALNNVVRHAGVKEAWVRLQFRAHSLRLEIEDHGKGLVPGRGKPGIGLVAMRERAELVNGVILFQKPAEGGTLVHLTVPREKAESYGKEDHSLARG